MKPRRPGKAQSPPSDIQIPLFRNTLSSVLSHRSVAVMCELDHTTDHFSGRCGHCGSLSTPARQWRCSPYRTTVFDQIVAMPRRVVLPKMHDFTLPINQIVLPRTAADLA